MRVNLDYGAPVLGRAHGLFLIGYAALLGLVEGPAQVASVLVLVTTLLTGRLKGWRPGVAEIGLVVWGLAGIPGTLMAEAHVSSGDSTRPLLALTLLIGSRALIGLEEKTLNRVAWAFGIACTLNAAYGLLQFLVNAPLPLEGLLLKNAKSAQLYVPNHVYHVRASSGLFYNRLKLAHVGMIGAFLIGMVVISRDVRRRTRLIAAAGGGLLGAGLLFTYARMALVSVVGACLTLAVLVRRWMLLSAVAATSAVVGIGLLLTDAGRKRMLSLSFDFGLRQTMAEAAITLFREHPILGVGHGVYYQSVKALQLETLTGVHLTSPHNLWLQVLAETGIVGFLGFNIAVGYCLYHGAKRARGAFSSGWARLDRLALLSLVALLFVGLMHFTLHHAPVSLAFWTLAGVCVRTEGRHGEETR